PGRPARGRTPGRPPGGPARRRTGKPPSCRRYTSRPSSAPASSARSASCGHSSSPTLLPPFDGQLLPDPFKFLVEVGQQRAVADDVLGEPLPGVAVAGDGVALGLGDD